MSERRADLPDSMESVKSPQFAMIGELSDPEPRCLPTQFSEFDHDNAVNAPISETAQDRASPQYYGGDIYGAEDNDTYSFCYGRIQDQDRTPGREARDRHVQDNADELRDHMLLTPPTSYYAFPKSLIIPHPKERLSIANLLSSNDSGPSAAPVHSEAIDGSIFHRAMKSMQDYDDAVKGAERHAPSAEEHTQPEQIRRDFELPACQYELTVPLNELAKEFERCVRNVDLIDRLDDPRQGTRMMPLKGDYEAELRAVVSAINRHMLYRETRFRF